MEVGSRPPGDGTGRPHKVGTRPPGGCVGAADCFPNLCGVPHAVARRSTAYLMRSGAYLDARDDQIHRFPCGSLHAEILQRIPAARLA